MKRCIIFSIVAILSLCFSVDSPGETPRVPRKNLDSLSSELLARSRQSREEARRLAESVGWPVRGRTREGRLFELQGILRGIPCYYTTDNNTDAAITTRTDSVQYYIGGGAGMVIGLWDGDSPRSTHQELVGRVSWGDTRTQIYGDHATHVAGTMIASGVSPHAKGMSPQAALRAYQWDDDYAEMAAEAAKGLLVSNHSYGLVRGWTDLGELYWFGDTAISEVEDYEFGFYDESARDLDELLFAAPSYLPVNSAGNDRNDWVEPGTRHRYYDVRYGTWRYSYKVRDNDGGELGYDCLPNGMATSKNALTVGAVKPVLIYTGPASVEMTPFSSWGPTDDGRIKPDICGDGWNVYSSIATSDFDYDNDYGTSMASPNVCGSLGLLQDYHRDARHGLAMRAATLKALVCHTAREAGPYPGPDYSFGWGLLDAYAAYRLITEDLDDGLGRIEELTLVEDSPIEFFYECDGTESELRVTIAWTDPPGTPPAAALDPPDRMLVNDLDLLVERDGATFEPWTLDVNDPAAPAVPGDNDVDNVEQVYVADPEPGIYVVRISNDGPLRGGAQDFSLVVSGARRANTWHVFSDGSGDAPTIAAAIDSAAAGDQILVYPGLYPEHDVVVNKPVTIKGIRGATLTLVDAGGAGRCFVFPDGAGPVGIEGLTLRNGAAHEWGEAGEDGGALYSANAAASVIGCVIAGSRANRGGGVFVANGLAEFRRNVVIGNAASSDGGGIYLSQAAATIEYCIVSGNRSEHDGGGMYVESSSPGIVNCTFAYNSAANLGGGMYLEEGCSSVVHNSIVAFTLVGEGAYQASAETPAGFACCDFYANVGGNVGGALADPVGEAGNFSADPQLCGAARGDYSIGDGSPCRPDGNACAALIGALEGSCHTMTTWRVAADGSGDAATIQAAIDRAAEGDTILLAPGTYGGEGNRDINLLGKNLILRGAGGAAATIIDCGASAGEVHWGFAYESGEDTTSVLDGVTIRGATILGIRCSASSAIVSNCVIDSCVTNGATRGGGIYLEKSSAVVRGCTLRDNRGDPTGGGIYLRESTSRIENCVLTGNAATRFGGGIAVHTSSIAAIRGCVITGNLAAGDHGGGIYIQSGRATIDSCVVNLNTGTFGGGLYNGLSSFCTIRYTTLAGNVARTGGGGVYTAANMTMENCTVAGNSAASYGGGIEAQYGTQNTISRSIVSGNLAQGGIYTIIGAQAISCSDVFGNAGGNYLGATPDQTGINNNFSLEPGFCDAGAADFALHDTSSCAQAHSPCGQLVGALDLGCRIAPNLAIESVNIGAGAFPAGRAIPIEIVVRNDGVADADSFTIDWYLDRSGAPAAGEKGDLRLVVPFLAVGDTMRWTTAAFASDTIGEWNGWAAVDAEGRTIETNESDNSSGPYTISWLAPVEPGWPAGAADCYTSPLLVDLDGDAATLEVVVGCDGALRAFDAGGAPLPGWPVAICAETRSAPAGGDIAEGPENEIVTSCGDGTIYAFAADGRKLWERAAPGSPASTPALADLDGDGKLEIVACAGNWLCVFEGNGDVYPGGWPLEIGPGLVGAPAVGDVDGDGSLEIAVAQVGTIDEPQSRVHLLTDSGAPFGPAWPVTVDTIVAEPVIGDVALSHADLEIVVAAWDGRVRVFDGSGALLTTSARVIGEIASSPALANFDRDGFLDVAVTSRRPPGGGMENYACYASVLSNGGELIESRNVGNTVLDLGHVPSPIAIGKPVDCISGTPDGSLDALMWNYAVSAGAAVTAAPAAGDIDGDGWVEIVAPTGGDSLRCFELRSSRFGAEALRWPLYRRDAARSGALGYEPVSGVDDHPDAPIPAATLIRSVYPNPFNPTARIVFEVAERGRVRLAVYDIAGREVAVVLDREMAPGRYEATWNGRTSGGRAAASGVYFCLLGTRNTLETKKIILLR